MAVVQQHNVCQCKVTLSFSFFSISPPLIASKAIFSFPIQCHSLPRRIDMNAQPTSSWSSSRFVTWLGVRNRSQNCVLAEPYRPLYGIAPQRRRKQRICSQHGQRRALQPFIEDFPPFLVAKLVFPGHQRSRLSPLAFLPTLWPGPSPLVSDLRGSLLLSVITEQPNHLHRVARIYAQSSAIHIKPSAPPGLSTL